MSWKTKFQKDAPFSIVPTWFVEAMQKNLPKEDILLLVKGLCDKALVDDSELSQHPARQEWTEMMYTIYLEHYRNEYGRK